MKQDTKSFDQIYTFAAFLFWVFVGAIVGFILGNYFLDLQTSGAFVSWKLLDGQYNFTEIVDANSSMVWAKTSEGKLYSWDCQYHECTWTEVKNVPADAHETYDGRGEQPLIKSNTCPTDESFSPSKKTPGKIAECALGRYWGIDTGYVSFYALLEDGTIWSWKHLNDVFNATMFIIPFSVLDGILVGSTIFFIIILITNRHSKNNKVAGSLFVLTIAWLISCNLIPFIQDYRTLIMSIFIINVACLIWIFYQFLTWVIQR